MFQSYKLSLPIYFYINVIEYRKAVQKITTPDSSDNVCRLLAISESSYSQKKQFADSKDPKGKLKLCKKKKAKIGRKNRMSAPNSSHIRLTIQLKILSASLPLMGKSLTQKYTYF